MLTILTNLILERFVLSKIVKKRCWAFVLYLDSAPDDWLDVLKLSGLLIAVSPYHDKDSNPDGTPKKPHYHIIVVYDGPTTFSNVSKLTESLNATIPIPLESVRGMYRYHVHADDADKYQYDDKERRLFNGFSIDDLAALGTAELEDIKARIVDIIKTLDFDEYQDVYDYLNLNDMIQERNVFSRNTLFFGYYLNSKRNKINKGY